VELFPDAPYEYARRTGALVFTAGACPLDADGATVAPGDRRAQAERCVDNLFAALAAQGASAADLLKTTIYVVPRTREDLVAVWDVVEARIGRVPSTLLGVAMLGYPDQLVEIEAVASVPGARGQRLPRPVDPEVDG
jgi:enamine deaminase RidA (YjgF/YER057c/UK114 family)